MEKTPSKIFGVVFIFLSIVPISILALFLPPLSMPQWTGILLGVTLYERLVMIGLDMLFGDIKIEVKSD